MTRKLVLLGATACAVLVPTTAAQARVVDCSTYADFPNTKISSARNMSCAAAVKVMKAYKGDISRTFKAPQSFTCTQVSGSQYGGQWRCTKGTKAFRFEFKD
jgi:hypothetical protein